MNPKPIIVDIADMDEFGAVLNCAVRYCLGRRTYMPRLVTDWITPRLPLLTNKTLWCFERDIEDAIRRDALGDPNIDAIGWALFLEAVRKEIRGRSAHENP